MAPRSLLYLESVRDSNGVEGFVRSLTTGGPSGTLLYKWPVWTTTDIPIDDGAGSDESYVFLTSPSEIVLGEMPGVRIQVSSEASYNDGSNVVSAFQRNQHLVRATLHHDMILRHDESLAVLDQVTWEAA
jgi:HK97 family phage major capsid protein